MMRIRLLLLCGVLLTGVVWAQTESPSSGNGGLPSAGQPSGPNQPLQNPLQEPVKPVEAQPNQRKTSTFDVGDGVGQGESQSLGELRLMTRNTEVGGDRTRSFLDPGGNGLGEFNYYFDRPFSDTRRVQVLTMLRATNDTSIDPEHNSLQKTYLRLYGPRDEYILGDALVNYSRLSFNQNIKGLSSTWKLNKNWKLAIAGGIFTDRWGSLYKDLLGRPYTAIVSGARLEHKLKPNSVVGFNFSSSDDLVRTLPAEPLGTVPMPASNRVGSIDGKFQLRGLRLDSEYAYSFTNFDTRSSSGCAAPCDSSMPQPGVGVQGDWGGRVEGSYRRGKLQVRSSYVRYQPNFTSINARQISDLQDFASRSSYDVRDWLSVEGTLRRSNDDLKRQLPFETSMWGPEARFSLHNLPFYRRAAIDFGYRHRIVQASDKSIDYFVRMPYVDLTLPYHRTYFTVGYERRQDVDSADASQTSNTNDIYVGLRGNYTLGSWHVSPTLRWELERQAHRPEITPSVPVFVLAYDSNRLDTVAVSCQAPRYFILELGFRDSSATILGPSGYRLPSYRAAVTYKFRNDENTTLIASFLRTNNFYYTSPNFDERVAGVTLVYKFGRRNR